MRMDKELEMLIEEARGLGLIDNDNLSELIRRSLKAHLFCMKHLPQYRGLFKEILFHPSVHAEAISFLRELEKLVHDGVTPSLIVKRIEQRVKPNV